MDKSFGRILGARKSDSRETNICMRFLDPQKAQGLAAQTPGRRNGGR